MRRRCHTKPRPTSIPRHARQRPISRCHRTLPMHQKRSADRCPGSPITSPSQCCCGRNLLITQRRSAAFFFFKSRPPLPTLTHPLTTSWCRSLDTTLAPLLLARHSSQRASRYVPHAAIYKVWRADKEYRACRANPALGLARPDKLTRVHVRSSPSAGIVPRLCPSQARSCIMRNLNTSPVFACTLTPRRTRSVSENNCYRYTHAAKPCIVIDHTLYTRRGMLIHQVHYKP